MPIAIDQHIHRRLKDEEGRLFAHVLRQAGRGLGGRSQGVYLFSADGNLLGFQNTASAATVKRLLTAALKKFNPKIAVKLDGPKEHKDYFDEPPEGGLVLNVTTKLLGGADKNTSEQAKMYLSSLGQDHMWLRKDEAEALAKGHLPQNVKVRLVRFHLIDNTRGEPPLWRSDEIKKLQLTLKDGKLTGSVHLETKSGDRGYEAKLLGFVDVKNGKIVRFDLVARGEFWGHGTYTRFAAPKGRFPLAVGFTLSDGSCAADRVVPGAARGDVQNYLR